MIGDRWLFCLQPTRIWFVSIQEREEKEEILNQLRLCLDLNDSSAITVDIDADADAEKPTLEIKVKSKVPLLGKYWFLVSPFEAFIVLGSNPRWTEFKGVKEFEHLCLDTWSVERENLL